MEKLIEKVQEKLNPKYMNSVYTWKQIIDALKAIEKLEK